MRSYRVVLPLVHHAGFVSVGRVRLYHDEQQLAAATGAVGASARASGGEIAAILGLLVLLGLVIAAANLA